MTNPFPFEDASWIYLVLFILFITVGLRVHGNFKFVGLLARDLVAVRERQNIFDDTVRETSLMVALVFLTCVSGGILLQMGIPYALPALAVPDGLPHLHGIAATALCVGLLLAYVGGSWLAYTVVGNVFSDHLHTWMWVRGFTAGIGFAAVFMFPLALVAMAWPEYALYVAVLAFLLFILVKIAFVFKGFRIFFTESSSWVVFLYYLCSLEIAPLIMLFGLARALAG